VQLEVHGLLLETTKYLLEQCCGSGSGLIRNILPVQDPDRYPFQANEKVDKLYFFPENFKLLSKIQIIMTHLTLMRKIKYYAML
jgi:hypothetical protein